MKYYIRIIALLTAAVLLLSVGGCGKSSDSLDRIEKRGVIVFGIAPESLPMSGGTQEEPTGLSVAIGNEIAARLGVEAEYIFITEKNAVQYMNDGIIDCYINMKEPDLKSSTQFGMVDSMLEWRQVAVVARWSKADQLVDLTGERVCVLSGSDANDALDAAEVFKSSMKEIVYTESYTEIMRELTGSTCAAAIVDEIEFMNAAGEAREKFVVINEPLASSRYVLAFAYADTTLRERVQSIYGDMSADGTLAGIRAEWVGIA